MSVANMAVPFRSFTVSKKTFLKSIADSETKSKERTAGGTVFPLAKFSKIGYAGSMILKRQAPDWHKCQSNYGGFP
jgi:hypothetical protein